MPVLKIKNANGVWQEVWGCTSTGIDSGNSIPCWSDKAKRLLITVLKSFVPEDQIANVNSLEIELFRNNTLDIETTAVIGTGILGKIILGRSV